MNHFQQKEEGVTFTKGLLPYILNEI